MSMQQRSKLKQIGTNVNGFKYNQQIKKHTLTHYTQTHTHTYTMKLNVVGINAN